MFKSPSGHKFLIFPLAKKPVTARVRSGFTEYGLRKRGEENSGEFLQVVAGF
jgi:hypothetical protein